MCKNVNKMLNQEEIICFFIALLCRITIPEKQIQGNTSSNKGIYL